jgi:hypothetical protein
MRGRLGRGGAGSPGTPDSTGARSPETGAGSLPSRVLPSPPPGIQRHRARNPVILSDHDLAVIQKAVAAARQDGKDDRQDVAAVRHRTGPGPGPPTEEPREIRPPEARCSAPPPAITQAPPAANPAPPWGTVPAILVPVPGRAVGGAGSAPEPAVVRGLNESRTRRLVLYAVAAAIVVVAAALADHGGVLPRVGANNSSHPTQVGGSPHRTQLLPPRGQPPVMHFGNAAGATSTPAPPSAQPTSPAAGPSGAQNPATPTGSPPSAESLPSATGEGFGGGPSAIAQEGRH